MTVQVAKNVIGFKVIVNCVDDAGAAINLTGATNLKIKLRPDAGSTDTTIVKTATVEGAATAGVISCLTESGDIDTEGSWLAQAFYQKGSYEGHTIPVTIFVVVANLDGT